MSKATFTPGPWRHEYNPSTGRAIFGANDKMVVSTNSGCNVNVTDANAQLLAAAPELFLAVKKLLPFAQEFYTRNPNHGTVIQSINDATAALAKVESKNTSAV